MLDFPEYGRLLGIVEDNLYRLLPEQDAKSASLRESMTYSLRAGGKRIRPVLLLAACELAGGATGEAVPYACAAEYIHTYSLIHDDLPAMDDDDLRRGKPSNHKVYGEAGAILAGDGLLSTAFEVMCSDMLARQNDPEGLRRSVKAACEIAAACGCGGMIAGQTADIEAEGRDVSPELLGYIQTNKTAALIRASAVAGGYIGGADEALVSSLAAYGGKLGLAFQIADDILDVAGSAEDTGKATGRDAVLRKATYPSVYGMDESRKALEALTQEAVEHMDPYGKDGGFFTEIARRLAVRTR
jgi:geranylgeranyl diphosphate synthase type II